MAADYPWYEVVDSVQGFLQGDFITGCPLFLPKYIPKDPQTHQRPFVEGQAYEISGEWHTINAVIITQSCDLEQGKSDFVLICPYLALDEVAKLNAYLNSSKGKEEMRRSFMPGYHMLAACDLPGFVHGIQVVDFRASQSMPFDFLRDHVAKVEQRLRLLPPYREHLAQAFARFFMRVGLPTDIPPFKK